MEADNATPESDSDARADLFRCTPDLADGRTPTPPDDYAELMAALREEGVVTVEGDACCGTCAAAAAQDQCESLADAGEDVAGYVVYHVQAVDRGWDSMYLGFGGHDYPPAAIAGMVMAAATDAGFDVEWEGKTAYSVEVKRAAE